MHHQIELRLPEGLRWEHRRLILPPNLSWEQWMEVGRYLRAGRHALAFWEADFYGYGRRNYGDEKTADGLRQLEFEFPEVKAMEALNKLEVRDYDFTPEHHFVLARAALPAPDQQAWLETSKREKLTSAELQLSIRKGLVTRIQRQDSDPRAGVSTFEGLRGQWNMLERAARPTMGEWSSEDVGFVLQLLAPIGAFIAELKARV